MGSLLMNPLIGCYLYIFLGTSDGTNWISDDRKVTRETSLKNSPLEWSNVIHLSSNPRYRRNIPHRDTPQDEFTIGYKSYVPVGHTSTLGSQSGEEIESRYRVSSLQRGSHDERPVHPGQQAHQLHQYRHDPNYQSDPNYPPPEGYPPPGYQYPPHHHHPPPENRGYYYPPAPGYQQPPPDYYYPPPGGFPPSGPQPQPQQPQPGYQHNYHHPQPQYYPPHSQGMYYPPQKNAVHRGKNDTSLNATVHATIDPKYNFMGFKIWGAKTPYDRILYYRRIKLARNFGRKVVEDVDFPSKAQQPNGTITYIEILDNKKPGLGGEVSILRGGIGYRNVTFHFKSQRSLSFDFNVFVYGHGN